MEGFDLSTISDVYVGSTQYSEIYYGSNKVWPTQSIPYDAEIRYLESTGLEYIITDLYADNNLGFEIEFMPDSITSPTGGSSTLFGSRPIYSNVTKGYQLGTYQNGVIQFGTLNMLGSSINTKNTRYNVRFTDSIANVNEQLYNINTNYTFQISLPLCIYALNTGNKGVVEYFIGKIYYIKFFNRTTLEPIAEYIPVRVGLVGYMYDKISGLLFGNSGTGSFILGPDKGLEQYTQVEYIESTSTGGQYIDLDILLYDVLNKQYDIAIKFNIVGSGKDGASQPTIFGCLENISPWPGTFIRMNLNGSITGRYIGANVKDNQLGNKGNLIELTEKTPPQKNVYNYNNSGRTHTWGTSLFCIFNSQNKSSLLRFIAAKLYYFKLFVEGALVRDMVPCISPDNIAGLYDLANDKFYSSPNGAEFLINEDYCKLTLDDDSVVYITDGNGTLTKSMIDPYRSNIVSVEFKGRRYTSIEREAFNGCTLLTTVNLSPNITSIGDFAFYSCTSLISVEDIFNVTSIGNNAFYGCALTSVDLSNCISIGNNAFRVCNTLTNVENLSNCTSISLNVFYQCISLTSIDLSNVTSIDSNAFNGCTSLTDIDLSNCTSINTWTFAGCTSLTNIGDTSNITSIGDRAFVGCSSLTNIDLSSCTLIGNNAFLNCSSLTSIGDFINITSIGNAAFYNCNKITGNINIGSSCISLGIECFKGMSGLSSMTFIGTTPPTCSTNVFASSTFTIRVPLEALETYKAADGFSDYASRIVGY